MTGDLAAFTAFFAARLGEDEAVANAAAADGTAAWHLDDSEPDPMIGVSRIYDANGEVVVYDEGSPSPNEAEHIARHDPARALRDAAAERKLLAALERARAYSRSVFGPCPPKGIASGEWPGERMRAATQVLTLEYAAKIRAERFSDHPDYLKEWAP